MSEGLFFAGNGVPIAEPTDVRKYLGKPYHWREGRSAYEAANSWFDARDVPPAIRSVLQTDPALSEATLLRATFERQTALDKFGRPSQTDVLALVRTPTGLAVLGIEAKVDETFGPTVDEWLVDASSGKTARLAGLLARLELDTGEVGSLRYQLLHRTVATLLEAEAAGAKDAALVVQSFSPPTIRAGFADFQRFATALGLSIEAPSGFLTLWFAPGSGCG
jgi:hypothetical protein